MHIYIHRALDAANGSSHGAVETLGGAWPSLFLLACWFYKPSWILVGVFPLVADTAAPTATHNAPPSIQFSVHLNARDVNMSNENCTHFSRGVLQHCTGFARLV